MRKAYSVEEAFDMFLDNPNRPVVCIRGIKEFEAEDYGDAEEFFISEAEQESL